MATLIRQLANQLLRPRPEPKQGMPRPFKGWTRHYFPHRLTLAPSSLHDELEDTFASLHLRRGTHINRLAPRGSAKTTWSTFAYPTYCALERLERHIVIGADTGDQAYEYVQDIRRELEENEALRKDYWPAIRGMKARAGIIELSNNVLIRPSSTGKRIRGRKYRGFRPSLIVIDDPQNLDHVISELMRRRSLDWMFKDVMEAGTPQTNVVVLGTALHRECLVCVLHANPGWQSNSKIYKSIEQFPDRMDMWENQWKQLLLNFDDPNKDATARRYFDDNAEEMTRGSKVLWDAREPLYTLMLKRAMNGIAAFNSEKQNDPTDPSMCEWPPEYFDWPGLWFDTWPFESIIHKVISLDPSKGKESRDSDYQAIVLNGIDHRGIQFVEAFNGKQTIEMMCADLCKHVASFQPEEVVIETNQFQDLIKPILVQTAKALGVVLPRIVDCENRENKHLRIRRLGPDLAQKSVRFKRNSPGTTQLIQQAQEFPTAAHDDNIDAWEMSRRRLKKSKSINDLW